MADRGRGKGREIYKKINIGDEEGGRDKEGLCRTPIERERKRQRQNKGGERKPEIGL